MESNSQNVQWLDLLKLESWQMEMVNHAVVEAECKARENYKEYGQIEKEIRGLYARYPFIDALTDRSEITEGRAFSVKELQAISKCLALEDDRRSIEQMELYFKGIRDGYALKRFLES